MYSETSSTLARRNNANFNDFLIDCSKCACSMTEKKELERTMPVYKNAQNKL